MADQWARAIDSASEDRGGCGVARGGVVPVGIGVGEATTVPVVTYLIESLSEVASPD